MDIRLYQCFAADHRVSMDIYADRVGDGLRQIGHTVQQFRPEAWLERYKNNRLAMRWLRYVEYPKQLARLRANDANTALVHHVVDHGYAHLVNAVDASRSFISVHDLIPILAWRGRFGSQHKGRKPVLALHSAKKLKQFGRLIASSQNTADDLVRELDIPASQIEVVPLPLAKDFIRCADAQIEKIRSRYGLSTDHFWILVSGSEFYKNHKTVLKVFNRLKAQGYPVKLLRAAKTGLQDSPFASMDADDIKSLYVPAHELPMLFSSVNCLLFPSLYEGFGYPVAEALACGTPVVCSNAASLPGVGGSVALYADATDDQGLAQQVEQVINDSSITTMVRKKGPVQVQPFSAESVAQELAARYRGLA